LAKYIIANIASAVSMASIRKSYIMLETSGVLTIGLTCTYTASVRLVPT
jgi:hypothetical protein